MELKQVFSWNDLEELRDDFAAEYECNNYSYKSWYPHHDYSKEHDTERFEFAEKINEKLMKHGMIMEDDPNFKVLIEIFW